MLFRVAESNHQRPKKFLTAHNPGTFTRDELIRNPQLKAENIFIHIQEELPISEEKEGKKTAKKKA